MIMACIFAQHCSDITSSFFTNLSMNMPCSSESLFGITHLLTTEFIYSLILYLFVY